MTQQPVVRSAPPSNGMATAGFVVSLLGLIASCGLLSPVGLVLSWVGMRREPGNGLAIAGFIMGIIGSLWLIVALAFGLFTVILAALGIAAAAQQGV